jgi:hypothetical protein
MSTLPFAQGPPARAMLGMMARQNQPVQLSHPFRGMLLTQEVGLVSLGANDATFQARRSKLCAALGGRVFLHSKELNETIAARVLDLNVQMGRLSLGEFELTGRPWTERVDERVQPRQPVRVALRCEQHTLPTFLENISANGVGLLIYKPQASGLELEKGQPVKLEFDLPGVRARLALSGRVANMIYPASHLALVGVQTFPSVEQARMVDRFIRSRLAEILDELDRVFAEALEPRSVKELYF